MSPISIGLDGLLIMLLLITLFVGLRLNGKLKGLRADHAGFAKAVGELDQALLRAEAGLAELRTASTQAQTIITARIQEARSAAIRLDEAVAKAALTPVPQPAPAQAFAPRPRAEPAPLDLGRPTTSQTVAAEAPIALDSRRDARSRARVDEDLFAADPEPADAFPRLKFAAGGRR